MSDITILYYTSNREDEYFEEKIRENIMRHKGDLPIVSVSQKPIDFGDNICVGERENCYYSEFRQIQTGLRAIKTKWILTTEADVLLPPEYFTFIPEDNHPVYRYTPVWIHFSKQPNKFYLKGMSDGIQLIDRLFFLNIIERTIGEEIIWNPPKKFTTRQMISKDNEVKTWSGSPAISFKTRRGVSYGTGLKEERAFELPYWGTIENIKKNYL